MRICDILAEDVFQGFCEEIEQFADNRLTNYVGGLKEFVILKSSVPTYTITAFWSEGTYKGKKWKPLFQRTNKPFE